jgi:hypothetical protein
MFKAIDNKKGKKVTWDMEKILKTNQDTSPRSLPIDEKKKGEELRKKKLTVYLN